jgi:hypothetical protein
MTEIIQITRNGNSSFPLSPSSFADKLSGLELNAQGIDTLQVKANCAILPDFFNENGVEAVSSLPYFLADKTEAQRGTGVFDKLFEALKRLNGI